MKLFALEAGTSGPTVVLLHGFGGSHSVWDAVVTQLAERCRVLTYDLPGHRNSHPWPETGKPKVAVDAVLADLSNRGIEQFHVAGHSMGGAIAMLMALEAPQRISSMSLFAPGGFGSEINARLLARSAAATTASELRPTLEAMTGWSTPVEDETVTALATWRAVEGQSDALVALSRSITRDGRQGAIPRERMAELDMPISLAWGTIDNVLPVAQTAALPPQFALHLLDGVGHMLPQEVPDFVAQLIAKTTR
ncbi:MAG: alpha/beta fold hydrolase [Rhizobiaceae bacterium]